MKNAYAILQIVLSTAISDIGSEFFREFGGEIHVRLIEEYPCYFTLFKGGIILPASNTVVDRKSR